MGAVWFLCARVLASRSRAHLQDAERNKQFILTFRDGADPTKQKSLTYRYEAETPKLAKQIVAKLTRLLELYNR